LGAADVEEINTIFRAAHSIKGGAGTFGFMDVSNFTHVMETLLDEMRSEKRDVTQESVNLLLESVDCLREMLTAVQADDEIDHQRVANLKAQLEALLHGESVPSQISGAQSSVQDSEPQTQNISNGWRIKFKPEAYMLRTGNDPLRMFRELAALGELTTEVDVEMLPSFDSLDPEEVHLSWELILQSGCSRDEITEVFSWVEDDCKLDIEPLEGKVPSTPEMVPANQELVPVSAPVEKRIGDRRSVTDRRKSDRRGKEAGTQAQSIRVDVDKVDSLINLVGELVITQSMLSQFREGVDPSQLERLSEGLAQLERNTRDMQESVMQIRMLPIKFSFSRFPRLVHDLSGKLGKQVELKLVGEQTELDKTVMEKIGDPLVHLVRNSLDHGIEVPDVRVAAGKPATGVLQLIAYHEGGNIAIEIHDDGAGLNTEKILSKAREKGLVGDDEVPSDEQINMLVFHPGFSTADHVSDVSGRGVGMDVVQKNIKDLGGRVEVESQRGQGSVFRIRLPLTLAILDGQLVRVGRETYVVPLVSIIESLQVLPSQVNTVAGGTEVYKLRDEYIPVMRLAEEFDIRADSKKLENGLLVVVEAERQKVGIFVDDLLGQQQVVIKSLETNYQRVKGMSGATILGDGNVALILDVPGLIHISQHASAHSEHRLVDENTGAVA
ncbi:MAG: chemotaxis protein CheA, partial [Gammaproteobacteria bacterium]|nr:chemotaxis protein CheA [Gammaproteobacteria bacterium]